MKINLQKLIPCLNVYSEYNFLTSFVKIDDYIVFLQKYSFSCGSLITENHLFGAWNFYKKCRKNNIKPLIGITLSNAFFDDQKIKITLFAQNFNGYQNLINISSMVMNDHQKIFLIQKNIKLLKDIIIVYSPLKNLNIKVIDFFEKNNCVFYFAIEDWQYFLQNKSQKHYQKSIPFLEVRYLNNDSKEGTLKNDFTYQIVCAIKNQTKISLSNLKNTKKTFFLKEEDFQTDFLKIIRSNLDKFISQIDLQLSLKKPLNLKKVAFPEQFSTSFDYLNFLCQKKLQTKNLITSKYQTRLQYELKVIKTKKLINYFLIVKDYVDFAYSKNILLGPGRGSAAGSLVAFLLNITKIDPLKYNLLFTRFLNLQRSEMPDIDLDFEDQRREEILNYLFQKYGNNYIAQITTFSRIGIKTALRDVGRVIDVPLREIDQICKKFPIKLEIDFFKFIEKNHILKIYYQKYPDLFFYAQKIILLPRQTGIHAAGIVISNQKLNDFIATWKDSENHHILQIEMEYLNDFGLVKMDLLALKNLSLLSNILQKISPKVDKNNFFSSLNLEDHETFALLSSGDTSGIFQIESQGMTSLIKKIKPQNIDDIANVISLYRPSAMKNIDLFLKRRNDQTLKINYYCDQFEIILKKTYGIPIYQEQIIEMVNRFAGLSIDESDILRKAISKKDLFLIKTLKKVFFEKGKQKNNPLILIETIWNLIFQFANYGFNRSHAISYAVIVYWMGYLKKHYFSKYILFLLNDAINDKTKTSQYLYLLKKNNVQLLPLSLAEGTLNYQEKKQNNNYYLIPPLTLIKQIRTNIWKKIINQREENGPFRDFHDLVARINLYNLDKETYFKLINSGACDFFNHNRQTLKQNLNNCLLIAKQVTIQNKQIDWSIYDQTKKIKFYESEPQEELWKNELFHLGLILDWRKFNHLKEQKMTTKNIIKIYSLNQLNDLSLDVEIPIFVLITKIIITTTKKGNKMAFLTICDPSDTKKIIVWPNKYQDEKFKIGSSLFFFIKIKEYYGKRVFIFEKLK